MNIHENEKCFTLNIHENEKCFTLNVHENKKCLFPIPHENEKSCMTYSAKYDDAECHCQIFDKLLIIPIDNIGKGEYNYKYHKLIKPIEKLGIQRAQWKGGAT